ncbi:hypothetical protein O1L68_00265 [Streptomyces lydicus]|nr:hypothetical protein [Streptomyces lydicus]
MKRETGWPVPGWAWSPRGRPQRAAPAPCGPSAAARLLCFPHAGGSAAFGIRPAHLIASGPRDAPYPDTADHGDAENAEDTDDAATVARLHALGGTDQELAADPEFQELVLPYVRADGRMFHAYTPPSTHEAPLR